MPEGPEESGVGAEELGARGTICEGAEEVGTIGTGSEELGVTGSIGGCLLYTSPSPRDLSTSRMPSSA